MPEYILLTCCQKWFYNVCPWYSITLWFWCLLNTIVTVAKEGFALEYYHSQMCYPYLTIWVYLTQILMRLHTCKHHLPGYSMVVVWKYLLIKLTKHTRPGQRIYTDRSFGKTKLLVKVMSSIRKSIRARGKVIIFCFSYFLSRNIELKSRNFEI